VGATVVSALIPVIGSFAGIFVGPLNVSLAYIFVAAVRREPVGINGLFSVLTGRYWWLVLLQRLIGIMALVGVIPLAIGVVIIVFAANADGPLFAIGIAVGGLIAFASILAYLYILARTLFAGLIFLDAPAGSIDIIECVKLSWRTTQPCAAALPTGPFSPRPPSPKLSRRSR